VEIYTEFIDDVLCRSLARLNSFSTMDETGMQPHPSGEKNAQAGANGPNKSYYRVCAIQTKQMLLAFLSSKGLIYSHIVPREFTITTADIVKVIGIFMTHMKKKRPILVVQKWFFTGTTPLFALPLLSRIGGPPTVSWSHALADTCFGE
jgi:hypothetical protein